MILPITQFRFQAFLHAPRPLMSEYVVDEHEWYADDVETTLGVLLRDVTDNDWAYAILQRDADAIFRAIFVDHSFAAIELARESLLTEMEKISSESQSARRVPPKRNTQDIFDAVVAPSKLNPLFSIVASLDAYSPAREMIREVFESYVDRDGNFVEQFQTTGFNSRIWELYLHACLLDSKFSILPSVSPDFIVRKGDATVAIEAVTANPTDGSTQHKASSLRLLTPPFDRKLLEIDSAFTYKQEDFVPIKLGSALYSKLIKRYWEAPSAQGIPIILAITTFHEKNSLFYSSSALGTYLYGYRHLPFWDTEGNLSIIPQKIETHNFGGKSIPSGFFSQSEAQHISAVLFSNSGTISKFHRMGQQGDYHNPQITLYRVGDCANPDPNATTPCRFGYTVGESDFVEWWGHGLEMFHNPDALHPVDPDLFPEITHHQFKDGLIYTDSPSFSPYSSVTFCMYPEQQS